MATEQNSNGHQALAKSVVVLTFPGGRELLWVAPDSPLTSCRVGDDVIFRSGRWRVTGRADDSDALSLTLGPVES
jgi:hypothetical protein